jgi:imidazolonepropionase-like amidohydrolase
MIRISTRLAVLLGLLLVFAGLSLQTSLAQAPAGGTVAMTGARVIDGTGAAPIEGATIVIANGRIQAVGAGSAVTVPAGATRVDMSGKTIMPGIINAHAHLSADVSNRPIRDKLIGQLKVYADYGVTTVVVLGAGVDDLDETVKLREEQGTGPLDRARVFVAGSSLRNLPTEQEARSRVDNYADRKADLIKIHITGSPMDMTPAVYGALIDEAHKRNLRVAAHLFYMRDARGLLDKNVDVIAHAVRDQPVDAAFIAEVKKRNVPYIPTLTRDLATFVYEGPVPYFTDPFFTRHMDAYSREMKILTDPATIEKTKNSKEAQAIKAALEMNKRNLKTLSDAGVLIAMGTDTGTNTGQWQGYFEQVEMEMMVQSGMTPMQVIVASTSGGARAHKLDQQLGTIQPGKTGDLLVLNANPLTDIRNTRQIHSVWIGGRRLAAMPAVTTARR